MKTKTKSIMDLAGAWKDISEADKMKARIMERRKNKINEIIT
jgi:hypothetical protein